MKLQYHILILLITNHNPSGMPIQGGMGDALFHKKGRTQQERLDGYINQMMQKVRCFHCWVQHKKHILTFQHLPNISKNDITTSKKFQHNCFQLLTSASSLTLSEEMPIKAGNRHAASTAIVPTPVGTQRCSDLRNE